MKRRNQNAQNIKNPKVKPKNIEERFYFKLIVKDHMLVSYHTVIGNIIKLYALVTFNLKQWSHQSYDKRKLLTGDENHSSDYRSIKGHVQTSYRIRMMSKPYKSVREVLINLLSIYPNLVDSKDVNWYLYK